MSATIIFMWGQMGMIPLAEVRIRIRYLAERVMMYCQALTATIICLATQAMTHFMAATVMINFMAGQATI